MLDSQLSDRELFQQMDLGDPWCDADLYSAFHYLWTSSSTKVPDSWQDCMQPFAREFEQAVCASESLVAEYNLVRTAQA